MRWLSWIAGFYMLMSGVSAQSTRPADDTVDWLMERATTAPALIPTTKPVSPFTTQPSEGGRMATLILSNGEKVRGRFSTTAGKPVRVWVEAAKEYRDVPFELIRSLQAQVVWERQQPEWHFKASGSDIKEYTGQTYPDRELAYVLALVNGQTLTGSVVAPLYLQTPDGPKLYVLPKRDKGAVGAALEQLIYVRRVEFDGPATMDTEKSR